MATNRYSLADYILTLKIPNNASIPESLRNKSFSIGGPGIENGGKGSFLGQISISRNVDAWSTEGDATGSWVHNKNNDKTGSCEVRIRQVSDDVVRLANIAQIYESIQDNVEGLTITITSAFSNSISGSDVIVTCNDCYIQKIADLEFAAEAQEQAWTFTCGQIFFYQ